MSYKKGQKSPVFIWSYYEPRIGKLSGDYFGSLVCNTPADVRLNFTFFNADLQSFRLSLKWDIFRFRRIVGLWVSRWDVSLSLNAPYNRTVVANGERVIAPIQPC